MARQFLSNAFLMLPWYIDTIENMAAENSRILVVDDDQDILDLLAYNLEKEGFKVKKVDNSWKALKTAQQFSPDLIILDIMMPGLDGVTLCEQFRHDPSFESTYIFFLTAVSSTASKSTALNSGGDDYIEKLMGLRSLICKVNSVLKCNLTIRKRFSQIEAKDLILRRDDQTVTFEDRNVLLTPAEFELLFFFVQNKHRIVSVDNIIQSISSEAFRLDSSVESNIETLRKKISPDIIRTINSRQYCFRRD